ncbi:Haloacid dehalogenase-like hydrolase-domain-containing protein [Astrocystis sublimbata]|nr:Haloacid dehalogenase-like hydrolase-domain-containing protein [Astrocystis sublimbata]
MEDPFPCIRGVIFDLGNVFFTWSSTTSTSIPARTLKAILSSPTWHSYERGETTRQLCYELSAKQFSLEEAEIAKAFTEAHESLKADENVISFLRQLKKTPGLRLYAMSNVGKEDFEEIATKADWSLFDKVFTSADAGMRKPEGRFFRYVLDQIDLKGDQVIFVDDKVMNVQEASKFNIRSYVYDDTTVSLLRGLFESPADRGWRYLFQNARECQSITSSNVTFADNFAKLLIADLFPDNSFTDLSWKSKGTWNFFADEPALVPGGKFPDDLDTTSLALTVLRPPSPETVSSMLDTMAQHVNEDGTFQTYYDRQRPRVDPIVSANVLACFYSYNRGDEFETTLQLVYNTLLERSYANGTRYYPSPDCCLGFIGRLLRSSRDSHLHEKLAPLLKSRVSERVGMSGSALDLAMRVMTCKQLGLSCDEDCRALLSLQCDDGSWSGGWVYQYGSSGTKIGNRCVTTAMAVAALSSRKSPTNNSTDGPATPPK